MFYGWVNVFIIWLFYILVTIPIYYGFGSWVGPMVESMNISMAQASMGMTIYNIAMGLAMPLAAKSINKMGAKLTLVIGAIMFVLGNVAMATIVNNVWVYWLVFGVFCGVGSCLATALPIQTFVSKWFTRKRATAMSLAFTGGGVGALIFSPIVARISTTAPSWHAVFWPLAICAGVGAVLMFFIARENPADMGLLPDGDKPGETVQETTKTKKQSRVYKNPDSWEPKAAYKTPSFWLVLYCCAIMFYGISCCISLAIPHFVNVGIAKVVAAAAIGSYGFVNIFTRIIAGVMGDVVEPRYVMGVGFIFYVLSAFFLLTASSAFGAYAFAFCFATGFGFIYISFPNIIVNYFGVKNFAQINGRLMLIGTLIGATSPFITGSIFDATGSYNMGWWIVLVLSAIAVVCAILARPPKKPGTTEQAA
jgi:OFA family oxalate/formate antiporter-like MFS transporter